MAAVRYRYPGQRGAHGRTGCPKPGIRQGHEEDLSDKPAQRIPYDPHFVSLVGGLSVSPHDFEGGDSRGWVVGQGGTILKTTDTGEIFSYGSGNYHAKVQVAGFESVIYDNWGNPRAKLVATILADSTIAETHTKAAQSKLVSKQRSDILGREDDIISAKPAKRGAFELKEDFYLGSVSPSHIAGVISGSSVNGSALLICSTEPYVGVAIGVVYACKHLTQLVGEEVAPADFDTLRSAFFSTVAAGVKGMRSEFYHWVRDSERRRHHLKQQEASQVEAMGTSLQTNTTAAADSALEHTPNWKWSDIVRPLEESVTGLTKHLLRFHSRKVPERVVREAAREWHNENKTPGKTPTSEDNYESKHWPCVRTWGLWRYHDHTGIFQMTPLGIGLARGRINYQQYMGCMCDRWQYPQTHLGGYGTTVDGTRLRPMVEIVRALKKLGENAGQAYLSKEEQHGFIQDVASRADVDGFVKEVIDSRTGGVTPAHWEKQVGTSVWPDKAMKMVCFFLIAADRVKRLKSGSDRGHIVLQGLVK
jgi:hypothetical protein